MKKGAHLSAEGFCGHKSLLLQLFLQLLQLFLLSSFPSDLYRMLVLLMSWCLL